MRTVFIAFYISSHKFAGASFKGRKMSVQGEKYSRKKQPLKSKKGSPAFSSNHECYSLDISDSAGDMLVNSDQTWSFPVIEDHQSISRIWIRRDRKILMANRQALSDSLNKKIWSSTPSGVIDFQIPSFESKIRDIIQGPKELKKFPAPHYISIRDKGLNALASFCFVIKDGDIGGLQISICRMNKIDISYCNHWKTLFSFTSSELELGRLLLKGSSVAEIAQHRNVAATTIRTQLRSLFAKTGTSRQSELATFLLQSLRV